MTKTILTVTAAGDLHADLVANEISCRGSSMFRLNIDQFPRDYAISLHLGDRGGSGSLTYNPTGETLALNEIGAVWIRKTGHYNFLSEDLTPAERAFGEIEARHLLLGLLYSLDCYWMSHPRALRHASWKGEQSHRAARIGFSVPRSLATNRTESAAAFLSRHESAIFKPLSSPTLAAQTVAANERISGTLETTLITQEHADFLDAVEEIPCFFQEYIPKDHELRITVIGNQVFAAKIHSQDAPETMIDWRDMSAEILYEKAHLPPEIERRCLDFVHSYGLEFGALDVIVTPAGDYVFLENNPAGQFLFIQELVPELDMIGAVADHLIEGAQCRSTRP